MHFIGASGSGKQDNIKETKETEGVSQVNEKERQEDDEFLVCHYSNIETVDGTVTNLESEISVPVHCTDPNPDEHTRSK